VDSEKRGTNGYQYVTYSSVKKLTCDEKYLTQKKLMHGEYSCTVFVRTAVIALLI
jgi:hypothetical protein